MELLKLDNFLRVLMDLANDVEEEYKQHLAQSKRYTLDFGLIDSIHTEIKVNDQTYDVMMNLNDYWKYVEWDTKPHFPPPDKILDWVRIKPVIPRPNPLGKKPTENQLAFLIGRKISQHGTKGSHDLEKTKDALLPFYKERLSEALGRDVDLFIRKLVNG